jgi:hypothetical protein
MARVQQCEPGRRDDDLLVLTRKCKLSRWLAVTGPAVSLASTARELLASVS